MAFNTGYCWASYCWAPYCWAPGTWAGGPASPTVTRWTTVVSAVAMNLAIQAAGTETFTAQQATFVPTYASPTPYTATYGATTRPTLQLQPMRAENNGVGDTRFTHVVDDTGPVLVQDTVPAVVIDSPGVQV